MGSASRYDHGQSGVRDRPELMAKFEAAADSLGSVLRRMREQRGLSQDAAAEASGLHAKHLGRIERGEANVTLLTMVALAETYDVRLRDLFLLKEKRPRPQ